MFKMNVFLNCIKTLLCIQSITNNQIFPIAFYYKIAPIVLFVVPAARDMMCHHLLCSLLCYVALKAVQGVCVCARACADWSLLLLFFSVNKCQREEEVLVSVASWTVLGP